MNTPIAKLIVEGKDYDVKQYCFKVSASQVYKDSNHHIAITMLIEDNNTSNLISWLADKPKYKEGTFMAIEESSYVAVDFRKANFEKHHTYTSDTALTITLQTRENDSERSRVHFKDIFDLVH